MPKNMFKVCVDIVPNLFLITGFLNTDNSITNSTGDNLAVCTKFLNNQITAFDQLNEWDLRRES